MVLHEIDEWSWGKEMIFCQKCHPAVWVFKGHLIGIKSEETDSYQLLGQRGVAAGGRGNISGLKERRALLRHCGPEQPRTETEVLGHSLVCLLDLK